MVIKEVNIVALVEPTLRRLHHMYCWVSKPFPVRHVSLGVYERVWDTLNLWRNS